jgi:hypothetical protein
MDRPVQSRMGEGKLGGRNLAGMWYRPAVARRASCRPASGRYRVRFAAVEA